MIHLIRQAIKYLSEPIPFIEPSPKQVKPNLITDYLKIRGERLISLRNKAIEEDNIYKVKQANFLITKVNERISERFSFNNFNFN